MSRWAGPLVDAEPNPKLDLDAYVGQRSGTFQFMMVDAITGYSVEIHPYQDVIPTISHSVNRTITRQISGLFLGVQDTAQFNTITSRVDISMLIGGDSYPLGRYMPSNQMRLISTGGTESSPAFYDEGFIIDQEATESFGSLETSSTIGSPVQDMLERFLNTFPISYSIEPSDLASTASWPMGTRGGYIVEQMAIDGDWFSPWFDNNNVMRFIRSFDPATAVPMFDFDTGNKVFRARIIESDDLITAPNRFVVISNGVSSVGENAASAVGVYEIPSSAPHSIMNRGFVIQSTTTRQLNSAEQANAVARNLGQRYTVYETVELQTAPDPRHDGYDVIRWQGENWLEIAWSLPLTEGGEMTHVMRKAYRD